MTIVHTDVVPTVDVSGAFSGEASGLAAAGSEVRRALEDVGFFYIVGHGADWSIVREAYKKTAEFHALPLAVKEAIAMSTERPRGYLGLGMDRSYNTDRSSNTELNSGPKKANYNCSFLMQRGSAVNQWPELPGFKEAVLSYAELAHSIAERLLPVFASSLELPADYFSEAFKEASFSLRLTHYPPVPESEKGRPGLNAHTDGGFLALLPSNDVRGLWIRPHGRDWMEAPNVPFSFLVNSGKKLQRWTNERFLATIHRVDNPGPGDRYAMASFYNPGSDTMIEALPTCVDAEHPAKYPPIRSGDMPSFVTNVVKNAVRP